MTIFKKIEIKDVIYFFKNYNFKLKRNISLIFKGQKKYLDIIFKPTKKIKTSFNSE